MYKQMQTMRRMEMAADALYKAKLIRGFCHSAIGQVSVCSFSFLFRLYANPRTQEAVSVGLEHGILPNDRVITAYCRHPFAVMRGGTIKGVIGELLGRQDGMSHGKGGSMHIFTPTFGGNGIVAMGARLRKSIKEKRIARLRFMGMERVIRDRSLRRLIWSVSSW